MTHQLEIALADLEKRQPLVLRHKGKSGKTQESKYNRVADRVDVFRRAFGLDYAIRCEVIQGTAERVRVRAGIIRLSDNAVIAIGHAEEPAKNAFAIEIAETSAVGRALAFFGLHGGEIASAEDKEMQQERKTTIKRTELKSMFSDLIKELNSCTDDDQLTAFLNEEKTQKCLNAVSEFMPEWFYGDGGDVKGWDQQVTDLRVTFQPQEPNLLSAG